MKTLPKVATEMDCTCRYKLTRSDEHRVGIKTDLLERSGVRERVLLCER